MQKYIANGVEVGWLIHPDKREVMIHTQVGMRVLNYPAVVRGAGPDKGFELDLQPIWEENSDFE